MSLTLEEEDELEDLREKLRQIKLWCEAYPLDIWPEPDLTKAAFALNVYGMTLDSISASNMRHVLEGVLKIIKGDEK